MKIFFNKISEKDGNILRKSEIQCERDPLARYLRFKMRAILKLHGGTKAFRVHSGIGSATSGYVTFAAKKITQSLIQLCLNGWSVILNLISCVIGSVVLDFLKTASLHYVSKFNNVKQAHQCYTQEH